LAHVYWPFYRGYIDDGPQTLPRFYLPYHHCPAWPTPTPGAQDRLRPARQPRLSIRRILDELVQVEDGFYLGKAHLKWWWGRGS